MVDCHFQVQLTAVLDVLVKTAVTDICALADTWFKTLKMEITKIKMENEDLREKLRNMEQQSVPDVECVSKSSRAEDTDMRRDAEQAHGSGTESSSHRSPWMQMERWTPVPTDLKAEIEERSVSRRWGATSDIVYTPVCPEADLGCPVNPGLKMESGCSPAFSSTCCEDEREACDAVLNGECVTDSTSHYPQPKIEEEEEEQFDISCLLNPEVQLPTHPSGESHSDGGMALNWDKDLKLPAPNNTYLDFLSLTTAQQDAIKCVCKVCGKNLSTKKSLTSHYRLHSGAKPFKCTQCEKSFAKKFNLEIHYNVHTGARPYGCTLCSKSFADPSAFRRHKRTHPRSYNRTLNADSCAAYVGEAFCPNHRLLHTLNCTRKRTAH